jgi:hypothetical protein
MRNGTIWDREDEWCEETTKTEEECMKEKAFRKSMRRLEGSSMEFSRLNPFVLCLILLLLTSGCPSSLETLSIGFPWIDFSLMKEGILTP